MAPAHGQETEFARIPTMKPAELRQLIGSIVGSVSRETLTLQPSARERNCAELVRATNAIALGYRMLGTIESTAAARSDRDGATLQAQAVQARVITFASRVRAEEWHTRVCANYSPAAEHAGDARYAVPERLSTSEFSRAVIDVRAAAEGNMAVVAAAAASKACPDVRSAMQSVQLFLPYLEKLTSDVAKRPQALGPRASRRALEVARGQLVAAANRLYRQVGVNCAATSPTAPDEDEPEAPADGEAPALP
jgi:hypothetical protein